MATIAGTLAAGLLCAGLGGCGKEAAAVTEPAPETQTIAVSVQSVRVAPLQRKVHVVGTLVGLEAATLSNKVAGAVTAVQADLGRRVKPNEKLAEIDPQRYRLALEQSRQTMQETLAKLGLEELPGKDFDVNKTAPVKKAQSNLDNARQKVDRAEDLHRQKLMSEYEYFDITSSYQVAQSDLQSAHDEARALVAQAQQNNAEVAMRDKDLHDATLCAPDGNTPSGQIIDSYAVTQRDISVGEYLKEGTPAFRLVADHVLKLDARVPERYLSAVALGQDVAFGVAAYKDEVFHGRIAVLDPSVDQASRTFLIEAYVDNAHDRLRSGSFVEGDVLIRMEPNVVLVPLDAITSFAGVNKLFVLDGQKVHQVTVRLGQQEGSAIEIDQKLQGTQQVVTSGQSKLFEGAPVRIVQRDEAATRTVDASSQKFEEFGK